MVTSAIPEHCKMLPPAAENGVNAISYYMMEEGMEIVGAVKVLGNVPCIKCGYGDDCETSGMKMIFGPEATLDSLGIMRFEDQPEAVKNATELGRKIAEALRSKE